MSDPSRILIAGTVAPLTPAVVMFVFSPAAAVSAAIFSYGVFLALGLPAIVVLRRLGKLNIFSLVAAGMAIGVISLAGINILLAWALGSTAWSGIDLKTWAWGACLGALAAWSFGALVGFHALRASPTRHGS